MQKITKIAVICDIFSSKHKKKTCCPCKIVIYNFTIKEIFFTARNVESSANPLVFSFFSKKKKTPTKEDIIELLTEYIHVKHSLHLLLQP